MPVYDYECKDCAYEYQEVHKINECPKGICPMCFSKKYKRLISFRGLAKTSMPTWIDRHLRGALQSETDLKKKRVKPIETRDDLNKHLKENNLVAVS